MALTKQIEMVSNFGDTVVFNNAYIKVVYISGSKDKLDIVVDCFKEKNGICLNSNYFIFAPSLNGDNFIKQAYLYLKSLSEYADAVDC